MRGSATVYSKSTSTEVLFTSERRKFNLIYSILAFTVVGLSVIMLYTKPDKLFHTKEKKVKYILEWAFSTTYMDYFSPFWTYKENMFVEKNCSVRDCHVTSDKSLMGDISKFDAIIFHASYIIHLTTFPLLRSPNQLYIYASREPSENTRYWKFDFRDFYNVTLSYKLDSDIVFPYLTIRDKNWEIIGPKKDMQWKNKKDIRDTSLDESVKTKLRYKFKAAAWFVSNCISSSGRENYVVKLQKELIKYGHEIDIYGKCGPLKCPVERDKICLDMIRRDYYFYLSFENSFCEDYVSEKLIRPLRHYAIPVVYGGANYTRFMPDGIYLDALILGIEELARQMNELMQDQEEYYQYFKWHNFYSYHTPVEHSDSDPFCQLCAKLHTEDFVKQTKVHNNFIEWWNRDQLENNL